MKNILIYTMTFLAILLPAVWFLLLSDSTPKHSPSQAKKESEEPLLFRLCSGPAQLLIFLGFGKIIRSLFPRNCREQQKNLDYAGLHMLTPERIFCTRIFLMCFFACAAGGIIYMIVGEDDRKLSSMIAAAIAAFVA